MLYGAREHKNRDVPDGNRVRRRCYMMLSPVIYLMMNGLFFTLRLSNGGGSFPRPLKAAEEKEYLERCAQGDLEARNVLVEHNLRLVAHIVNNDRSERKIFSIRERGDAGDVSHIPSQIGADIS